MFHLSYSRDGILKVCNCGIRRNHDVEALTRTQVCLEVHELITKFYQDLAYVAPELYEEKFAILS